MAQHLRSLWSLLKDTVPGSAGLVLKLRIVHMYRYPEDMKRYQNNEVLLKTRLIQNTEYLAVCVALSRLRTRVRHPLRHMTCLLVRTT